MENGFGDDFTVDRKYTSGTADAVEKWEKSIGRADPDGVVEPSEILLVGSASEVVDRGLQVGDPVPDGTQVLTLATSARVITAQVDADDAAQWRKGSDVSVQWSDGARVTDRVKGRVTGLGRDVVDGSVEVTVKAHESGEFDQRIGTCTQVVLVTEQRDDVLAVPVAAVHDGPGGDPAVTVVVNGLARVRSIKLGLVAQGWAEVTSGVRSGEQIQLPGQ